MALIDWGTELGVGIRDIDEDHRKLVGMINDLHSAMGGGKGKEAMEGILAGLVDYTKTHFAREEQLMQKHAYPGYLGHKPKHDDFTKQVVELQSRLREGKTIVTVQVMNFLKDWLTTHIMDTDKLYAPYFKGKGLA
jgi:hemerythrin